MADSTGVQNKQGNEAGSKAIGEKKKDLLKTAQYQRDEKLPEAM